MRAVDDGRTEGGELPSVAWAHTFRPMFSIREARPKKMRTALLLLALTTRPLVAQGDSALRHTLEEIARASGGRLGVGVELLETGKRVTVNDGFHYPMQSVYKLPIAMAVLHRVDAGELGLDSVVDVRPSDFVSAGQHSPVRDAHPRGTRLTIRELLRFTVSESDGSTSDVALRLAGGPSRVMRYLRGIGVRDVVVATTEQEIGRDRRAQFQDWATPSGCLSLLRAVAGQTALSDSSHALVMRYLTSGTRGSRRLAGLLPPGTPVAHKPGSSGTAGGITAATNDIGIVTLPNGQHVAIAVLLTNARGSDAARDSVIARASRAAYDALFTEPREMIDVGGYRLQALRAGSGGPTVVFEAGLGDSLDTWAPVWPAIATTTTIVAYSRAGFGRSEAGPADRSARREVEELHTLLARLRLPSPYVLVGRSYGSILVRLYTSLYPREVAGLVIVEGTHEQQVMRWGAADSSYPPAFRAFFDSVLRALPPGAQAGEVRETMRIQAAGAVEGMTPLPDIPIAVLTSMKSDSTATFINASPRGHVLWREMHDEWFRRSRNGIHIETTHSGHDLQHDEPQLVIDAIRFVLGRLGRDQR
jgi:beta-lactamase class A